MDAREYYDADEDEANNVFASVSVYAMYIVVPLSIDDHTCIIILAQLLYGCILVHAHEWCLSMLYMCTGITISRLTRNDFFCRGDDISSLGLIKKTGLQL